MARGENPVLYFQGVCVCMSGQEAMGGNLSSSKQDIKHLANAPLFRSKLALSSGYFYSFWFCSDLNPGPPCRVEALFEPGLTCTSLASFDPYGSLAADVDTSHSSGFSTSFKSNNIKAKKKILVVKLLAAYCM